MWLSTPKQCADTPTDLKWKRQLKILGILFNSCIPASSIEDNWSQRLCKVQQIIAQWKKQKNNNNKKHE